MFKRKILVHLRGSNFRTVYTQLPKDKQKRIRDTLNKCTGAIVLGKNLRYIFEPFFPPERIHVVPNGGNYTFLRKEKPKRSINQHLNLIYLGNLQPSKGIIDVIEAFIQLPKEHISTKKYIIKLNIIGKWRNEETKVEILQKLHDSGFIAQTPDSCELTNKATHQVIYFRSVLSGESKLDLLVQSDIMIFPPREPEGHPWVIVEAMAAGLAIISTDQGAITESVINDLNGYIVESKNPKAIAEKLIHLINNPSLRERMGESSRILYEEKFTEEKMVENLIRVFNSVTSKEFHV